MKVKSKALNVFIFAAAIFICICSANAKNTYEGTVEPFMVTTLNIGGDGAYRGVIETVARCGSIIFPSIYNSKGKLLVKGDVLVKMRPNYFKADILSCMGKVDELQGQLISSKLNYERSEKLVAKKVVSQEDYQKDRDKYYDNVYQLQQAKNALVQANITLENHTVWAPYAALVQKVFIPGGLCSTIPAVVEVAELNPVWITVPMDRKFARKIKYSTPVTVTSEDGKTVFGVIHEFGRLTDKGYQFALYNRTVLGDFIDKDGKKIPVIRNWHHVIPYSSLNKDKILAVPRDFIMKDKKGHYVWIAEGTENCQPNKGISQILTAQKEYIKPTDVYQQIAGSIGYTLLNDSGKLKPYQLVIMPPDQIKDGETVFVTDTKFVFMPGDKVKVEVGD